MRREHRTRRIFASPSTSEDGRTRIQHNGIDLVATVHTWHRVVTDRLARTQHGKRFYHVTRP